MVNSNSTNCEDGIHLNVMLPLDGIHYSLFMLMLFSIDDKSSYVYFLIKRRNSKDIFITSYINDILSVAFT